MYGNQQQPATTIWDDPSERMTRLSHLRQSTDNNTNQNSQNRNHTSSNYPTNSSRLSHPNANNTNSNYSNTNNSSWSVTEVKRPDAHIDYIDSNPGASSSGQYLQQAQRKPYWHSQRHSTSPQSSIFDSSMTMAASQRASLHSPDSPEACERRRFLSGGSQSQNSNQNLLNSSNGNSNKIAARNAIFNYDNSKLRKRRPLGENDLDDDDGELTTSDSAPIEPYSRRGCAGRCCLTLWRWLLYTLVTFLVLALCGLVIYFYPIEGPQFEHKRLPGYLPRPKFAGPWQVNGSGNRGHLMLDEADALFEGAFHGPESMAWTADRSAFYTGVEGGFILRVEPYAERWFVVARLNSRSPAVQDLSHANQWELPLPSHFNPESPTPSVKKSMLSPPGGGYSPSSSVVPFCTRDVELYGRRAEFEPSLVYLSRCSRPLGLRLAPDDSHMFVSDSLSGLYKITGLLNATREPQAISISRLIRFEPDQNAAAERASDEQERSILFGDDIAVDWQNEIIYMTDCSQRWNVRYLVWLMAENDDSGRVLQYNLRSNIVRVLGPGTLTPVRYQRQAGAPIEFDWRNVSFPNGIELSPTGDYFMLADLNNRRIIKHHLRGPLAGQSEFLIRVPGFPDNVRLGEVIGTTQTYWAACACATGDWDNFEIIEFLNTQPWISKLVLKSANFLGWTVESLGKLVGSASWQDTGVSMRQIWSVSDVYCTHSFVFQFDEAGRVLHSIHAPSYSSKFKVLSEVSQVPYNRELDKVQYQLFTNESQQQPTESLLYLGSVYYGFLGRLKLPRVSEQFQTLESGSTSSLATAAPLPL